MFVLQRGAYSPAKFEYSYGRRAQSVTYTLSWKDIALIDTESMQEAISESESAIAEWKKSGYTADRWRIEGRGKQIHEEFEIDVSE